MKQISLCSHLSWDGRESVPKPGADFPFSEQVGEICSLASKEAIDLITEEVAKSRLGLSKNAY